MAVKQGSLFSGLARLDRGKNRAGNNAQRYLRVLAQALRQLLQHPPRAKRATTMLQLARQAQQTLKLPFVCSACRTLLAQAPAPRRRLPTAISQLGTIRRYTDSTTPPPPPPATTTEDATSPPSDPPAEGNEKPGTSPKKSKPKNKPKGPKSAKKKNATDPSRSTDAAGIETQQDLVRDAVKKVLKEGVLKKDKSVKGNIKSPSKKSKPAPAAPAKKTKIMKPTAAAADDEAGENQEDKPKKKAKKKKATAKPDLNITEIDPKSLRLTPIEMPQPPVPTLAYGLDRVLFNPGVSYLQDPRSKVYNHDPYVSQIMPTHEFDFGALKEYITSSRDKTLIGAAAKRQKKYSGSTSSMTATLAHFHFLLSAWRPINTAMLSQQFDPGQSSEDFNRISRSPAAIFLHHKDGTYAIDADKEYDSGNILAMLGKSMEKLLTMPKEEFEKYRKSKSDQLTDEEKNGPESYHYTTLGDFMMRSQLDAYDPRLPGTGMFDLKTRAVVTIRMDPEGYEKGQGYEIRGRFGTWESYEREYFDMIRSAFLKYSLQVRMGRMDGIFVAFHNTERIFGFQYIPLQEMDVSLHGASDTSIGDNEFKLSVHLLNEVLNKVTDKFPGQTLRIHFETVKDPNTPYMCVFARPVTQERINEIQKTATERIQKFERVLRGLDKEVGTQVEANGEDGGLVEDTRPEEDEEEAETAAELAEEDEDTREDVWDDVMLKVEHSLENEEHGATSIRESIHDALEQSGLLKNATEEEAEHYVQALFEVLTSEANQAATDSELAEEVEEADSDVAEESEAKDKTALVTQSETDSTETTAVESSEVEDASTEVESVEEDQEITPESSPEKLNLKDLILRLASRLQEESSEAPSPTEEGEVTAEEDDDAVKLAQFENIMSELLVKTRNFRSIEEAELTEEDHVETAKPSTDESTEELVEELAALSEEEIPKIDTEFAEPIYGLILTTKNKIDGKYVERPLYSVKKKKWTVEYTIEEMSEDRAMKLYRQCHNRRRKFLAGNDDRAKEWYKMFGGKLPAKTDSGRKFRAREEQAAKEKPVHIYGHDTPYTYESVFPNIAEGKMSPYQAWFPDPKELQEWRKSNDKMAWFEKYKETYLKNEGGEADITPFEHIEWHKDKGKKNWR
ncbi:mitochondrial protein Pet127-domain-containing protein [Triangularia setosa]|uniref:Mitochondrial protein Pet127-domain-containing protein n=1 Tax=Triangularia setosa TaxID=2587417 RepID=A0AAN6WAI1_9PEZI|nr:mitochondrial protein Pet127-domain-containing protein [Podospora setosa]